MDCVIGLLLLTCHMVSAAKPQFEVEPLEIHPLGIYGIVDDAQLIDSCGGVLIIDEEGEIGSERPHAGGKFGRYAPNMNCHWGMLAPVGWKVQLEFTEFIVQRQKICRHDYVRIHDGYSYKDPTLGHSRMCGHRRGDPYYPPAVLVSSGRAMLLQFWTNAVIQNRGWNATVTFFQ